MQSISNQEHSAEKIVIELQNLLAETPGILFAVLVGSRANGSATQGSDWDIAIQWQFGEQESGLLSMSCCGIGWLVSWA